MENNEEQSIEDNLPMVNYIMLHRVYDVLCLIAKQLGDVKEIEKMVEYHKEGFLLGPSPAFISEEKDE